MTTSTTLQKQGPPRATTTRRALLGGGVGTLALIAGGSAWAADRYLIDHVQIDSASAYEASQGTAPAVTATTGGTVSGTTYTSDLATIDISTTVVGSGTDQVTYVVGDVTLTDATALRSAFANDEFGLNIIEVPSAIASSVNAVFAVNGDYYGFRDTGIVIRNGTVFRAEGAREGLAFYRDGTMRLYDETTSDADQLVKDGVWQTLSFGPGLVKDGRIVDGIDSVEVDTNFGNHSIQGLQPRTAIGLAGSNHLIFIVVDGRSRRLQPRRGPERARPALRRPGRDRGLQPRRWRLVDDGLRRPPGEQPARPGPGARHLRHPLHRRLRGRP